MQQTPLSDSVLLNVCIIPPASVGTMCIELSKSLDSKNTLFVLDGVNRFPHMTLFMARFPKSAIPEVIAHVQEIAESTKEFVCKHAGYFMTDGQHAEVSYVKSKELLDLHEKVIEMLKRYRYSAGNPVAEKYFDPYTSKQKVNAQETGYDLAHSLYRPHITLTRYKTNEDRQPFLPDAKNLSFVANTIAVYKADDNGAVFEELGTYRVVDRIATLGLDFKALHNTYFAARHGESVANREKIIVSNPKEGTTGYPLTEEGREQVRESFEKAIANNTFSKPVIIFTSDFLRARETADIASELVPTEIMISTEDLRERFFGLFEKSPDINYQKVWDNDNNAEIENSDSSETAENVRKRALRIVQQAERHYENKDILIVSHGDTLRILETAFRNMKANDHMRLTPFTNAEIRTLN